MRCARIGHDFATVGGGALAHASGIAWEALAQLSRADAAQAMIKGGGKMVQPEGNVGEIDGWIIGVGGANGSTMFCAVMRQLGVGLPKAMVTPVAATAAVQWYVAESDIAMFPTIGDISLNRITRAAMINAAAAMAGIAKAYRSRCQHGDAATSPPLIGVSSFGNTQAAVDRITARLEVEGFEMIPFPCLGPRRPGAEIARSARRACRRHRSNDFRTHGFHNWRCLQRWRTAPHRGRRDWAAAGGGAGLPRLH